MSSILKEYNLTLNDIEMNRHFPDVRIIVEQKIKEKELNPDNIEHQETILRIWCEVIKEWKQYI